MQPRKVRLSSAKSITNVMSCMQIALVAIPHYLLKHYFLDVGFFITGKVIYLQGLRLL